MERMNYDIQPIQSAGSGSLTPALSQSIGPELAPCKMDLLIIPLFRGVFMELAPCKMDLLFLQAQADRVCPMGGIRSYIACG